jgi:hypothetical protein
MKRRCMIVMHMIIYDNISYPYLPEGTTYTTYYMSGQGSNERLVIGADGSAYYSPDHYRTWYKM